MTESSRKPNLIGRLALESIVIVASILFAFSLDTWWNARSERTDEITVLENLKAEFLAAGEQLDRYILFHQRIAYVTSVTLTSVQEALADGRPTLTIPDTAIALLYVPPTFNPRLGTLDELMASGRLMLLKDHELRRSLAGWSGFLAEGTEEEEKILQYVMNHLGPVLRTRMDVSRALEIPSTLLVEGALSPEENAQVSGLSVDPEVAGVLAARLRLVNHAIEDLEPARNEIDRIVALVEASL